MEAKLLKPTTDTELAKYHSREEVLIARGIRKVVEWGEADCDCEYHIIAKRRECRYCWQAKLKEWGIDDKAL